MSSFQDKRYLYSLFPLIWIIILAVLLFSLWLVHRPANLTAPTMSDKIVNPAPENLLLLYDKTYIDSLKIASVSNNPYYYPVPAPPPAPPPPPPPAPTTKQYSFNYKGFFTTTHGDKFVYLGVGDTVALVSAGNLIVEDLYLREIFHNKLILKTGENSLSELTLELPFDTPVTSEIPLKK